VEEWVGRGKWSGVEWRTRTAGEGERGIWLLPGVSQPYFTTEKGMHAWDWMVGLREREWMGKYVVGKTERGVILVSFFHIFDGMLRGLW
jgi:hypothetical protein